MNSLEFWRVVNLIVANLYAGHTVLGLSAENIFLAAFYFPFYVEFTQSMDAILVKNNLGGEDNLIPGDKIT